MMTLFLKMLHSCFSLLRLKSNEVHLLSDTLAREQKKSQQLKCALAAEKAKSCHDEEQDKELKVLSFGTLENGKL